MKCQSKPYRSGWRNCGEGTNLRETGGDPTAHAEVVAKRAAEKVGNWRLIDTTLYVTLEPCPMCAGALVNGRVSRLVYGCADPKVEIVDNLYRLVTDQRLNHRLRVRLRQRECAGVLQDFFVCAVRTKQISE